MKIYATLKDGFKVDTKVGNHSYILDQSTKSGGTDQGTNPSSLLMSSVAGCKIMVAKSFLDSRKIAFDKIDAEFDFEVTGPNLRPSAEGKITIKVIGATIDDKEQQKLHRIVDTGCPVANLLDSEKATIRTEIEVVE